MIFFCELRRGVWIVIQRAKRWENCKCHLGLWRQYQWNCLSFALFIKKSTNKGSAFFWGKQLKTMWGSLNINYLKKTWNICLVYNNKNVTTARQVIAISFFFEALSFFKHGFPSTAGYVRPDCAMKIICQNTWCTKLFQKRERDMR